MVNAFLFFTLFGPYPHLDRKPTDFGAKTFIFLVDLHILLDRKPTHLQRRPFFLFVCFGLYLCLDRERVPPRNPSPGATILSTATGNNTDCLPILSYVNLFQNKWLTKPGCSKTQTLSTFAFLASFIYRGFFCLKHNTVRTAGSYSQTLCQLRFEQVK